MVFRHTVGALRLGARWRSIVVAAILLAVLAAPARAAVPVNATVETEPELHAGDAADDSAIWIHPTDPSLSTVIGTDKTSPLGGLDVFDLSGRRLYFYADARMNTVVVRFNFPLGATQVSLVGVTIRSAQRLDFY
jgi:myo-inositol-hexaphosphate 3-phosphohydrolase